MSDEPFLSRWSQRKRQVAEEARKAQEAAPAAEPAPGEPEPPFDLSQLPDLEALTAESDMRLFLQKGVPDELRNAALRKMWALDPAIRDYVGDALDYAWDWNAVGGVPGGGELGPGFDTAKMVAQIFGDDVTNKDVIEDVAAPQVAAITPEMQAEAPPASGEEPRGSAQTEALTEPSRSPAALTVDHLSDAAPQHRRRHGGASPTGIAKSRMS